MPHPPDTIAKTRPYPAPLIAGLYLVGAAGLAALLIFTELPDFWLYLLAGPVLLAAGYYSSRVYLVLCGCMLAAALAVVVHRDPLLGPGFRNAWFATGLVLLNAEMLHRMVRARVRAEAGLRELLGREQAARADAQAARERFAFLAGASGALAASLDLETTLTEVARQAVPFLAELCVVRMASGGVELHAGVHSDAHLQPLLDELCKVYGCDLGIAGSGSGMAPLQIDEQALAARDDGHRRLLSKLGPTAALVAPLVRQEHVVGSLTLVRGAGGRPYTPEDVELAEELARRAAIAVENARLHHAMRETVQRKVEFLAMLAHELRNPLAAISNSAYLLEHAVRRDPHAGRLVQTVMRQSRHLARLVDDLLEVSRITHGKLELRREPVELVAATSAAVESVRPLVEARRHVVQVDLPEQPLWIEADPTRYEQILVNLLTNAAKYTEEGGRIALLVAAEECGSAEVWKCGTSEPPSGSDPSTLPHPHTSTHAVIRVRDSGIGITPDLLPHIFDLFTQGEHSFAGPRAGLGIGLSLVKRLVELHGGSVTARSDGAGRGSEFEIRLPLLSVGQDGGERGSPLALGQEPAHPSDFPVSAPPRRVLIVDDDRDAAETLSELLEMWGHEVRLARDGPRGLEAARQHQPEVALLDIGMPGMDGCEVARRLRADRSLDGVLLVALTGYGAEADLERSREAGFDYHLVKPADPDELRRLLAHR